MQHWIALDSGHWVNMQYVAQVFTNEDTTILHLAGEQPNTPRIIVASATAQKQIARYLEKGAVRL